MYALAEPRPDEAVRIHRDDFWLHRKLTIVWETFFPDVPCANAVEVSFARYWITRLGLITLANDCKSTYIGINALLRHEEVPEFVHVATLAHELAHYAHGFGSPLPQRYRHPHRGGVVLKELRARGLAPEQRACQDWIHDHWRDLCTQRLRPVRLSRLR